MITSEIFTSTTLVALVDLPFVLLFIVVIFSLGGVLVSSDNGDPIDINLGFLFQKRLQYHVNATFKEGAEKNAMLIEVLSSIETVKE